MQRLIMAAAICAVSATTVAAQEIRFLNAFDTRYPPTKMLVQKYADTVEKATAGKTRFRISGPEVVNAFQQFEPVTKGAFDLLFTVQPYHVGTTSVSLGIYSLEPDPAAFRQSGLFDFLDKEYNRFNLKLLAIIPGSRKGNGSFHAMLRDPVTGGDIKGRRVRGNRLYQPLIENLGASMVVLQVGEVYQALQKGTIDGAFGPVSGSGDYKWHEVAKYSMRPTFGYIYQFLLVNQDSFKRLAPEVQRIMVEEAQKLEVPGQNAMDEQMREEDADLQKRGMVLTQLSPERYAEAVRAYNDGIWQTAESSKATGDRAKAFHAFVKEKGLRK
jgi:TRAP-type C4-dicarboxylate transport system substrate-binding protein